MQSCYKIIFLLQIWWRKNPITPTIVPSQPHSAPIFCYLLLVSVFITLQYKPKHIVFAHCWIAETVFAVISAAADWMEKLTLLFPFQSIYCRCYPQCPEYKKILSVHLGFTEEKEKKLATVNRNQICRRGGSHSHVWPMRAPLGAAAAPGASTTGCRTWGQGHHPTSSDPLTSSDHCRRHAAGEGALCLPRAPLQCWGAGASTQLGPLHSTAAKADSPPTGASCETAPLPSTAEGQDPPCAAEVAGTLHTSIPSLRRFRFAAVWITTPLLPARLLSPFPESPVLFRLCSDKENATTIQVQNRDPMPTCFTPNQVHREGGHCAVRRDTSFSHAAVSPGQGWGEHSHTPLPPQPVPAGGLAPVDSITHLLRKQG